LVAVKPKEFVSSLTLQEKCSLLSGADYWHTKAAERVGLNSIMVADGPHGLRKQDGNADHVGLLPSVAATCFPTACTTGSSFDVELLAEIGQSIGQEALAQGVSVVLGPGVNIKRSPLCGRNFEYFSEDPLLSGKLAAAWIEGVQSKGVGASLKHFAANSQEYCRMVSNSIIDERALREIYLAAFEIAIKQAQPKTVMCSYNLINGTYASDNKRLLTNILRDEWGFEGLVVSDWGAVNNRVAGVSAGLDLEMPYSGGYNDGLILAAVQEGLLDEAAVDEACERVVSLVIESLKTLSPESPCDYDAHHALARRAAAESCVLLKNEGGLLPLPLDEKCTIAVIGAFATEPRYQGTGSSRVNPRQLDKALSELEALGEALELAIAYEPGYSLERFTPPNEELIGAAALLAKKSDIALVFAGLPGELETEGADRLSLAMPEAHNQLIEAVAAANPHTVVILSCGSPVETPWAKDVQSILVGYLGGEAGGGGVADVLTGRVNPSGKLAETWPLALKDTPAYTWYPHAEKGRSRSKDAEYRESVYVGYRYYDTSCLETAWPLGFGLSYTSFAYSALSLSSEKFAGAHADDELAVSFTLTNTGNLAGAEVVQLYVGFEGSSPAGGESANNTNSASKVFRPHKELRAFDKVFLEPGESSRVELVLDTRAFSYYNAAHQCWAREAGNYRIMIAASSRDIRLSASVSVEGDGLEEALSSLRQQAPVYYELSTKSPFEVPDEQFAVLLEPLPGRNVLYDKRAKVQHKRTVYDHNTTLRDIEHTFIGSILIKQLKSQASSMLDGEGSESMIDSVVYETPLRSMMMMSGGAFTASTMNAVIDLLNKKYLSGIKGLLRKS